MIQQLEFGADAKAFIRLQLLEQETVAESLRSPARDGPCVRLLLPTPSLRDCSTLRGIADQRTDLEAGTVDYEYKEEQLEFIAAFLRQPTNRLAIFRGSPAPSL